MSVSWKPGTELHWDGSKISLTMGRTVRDGVADAQGETEVSDDAIT
jgi:hypothetical protein